MILLFREEMDGQNICSNAKFPDKIQSRSNYEREILH